MYQYKIEEIKELEIYEICFCKCSTPIKAYFNYYNVFER